MFTEQLLKNEDQPLNEISQSIQDQELRKQSDQLLLQDFDELAQEAEKLNITNTQLNEIERLRNIVRGIGARFKVNIMDETCTQRRVFSFSISGEPSKKIKAILKLGVIHGYFYMDSINAKNGMERVTLYVLTRRLAPAFSLDPIGFSGYLTLTTKELAEMSEHPQTYINRLRKKKKGIDTSSDSPTQLSLLEGNSDA